MFKVFLHRNDSFISFYESFFEKRNLSNKAMNERMCVAKLLTTFGITRFKDVMPGSIENFNEFLLGKGYKQNYIHSNIRIVVKYAIKLGYMSKNPYREMSLKRNKTPENIRYISAEDLEKIQNTRFRNRSIQYAADIFLFAANTGLSYVDIFKLEKKQIIVSGGRYWLKGNRTKTGAQYYTIISKLASDIMKKYNSRIPVVLFKRKNNDCVFPCLSLAYYNILLKDVARDAGLSTPLNSHMARHTFATEMINKGASLGVIAKMLGHARISTTEIYAKITANKVEKEIESLAIS